MKERCQVLAIIQALKERYPDAICSLQYEKDYELLFAVRLSAQCTDERVNKVTPALFRRFPTLESFAQADPAEVGEYIHSCGFYNGKSKDLVNCARMLIGEYDGKVPSAMEDLLRLPGVGRKTANLIQGDVFQTPGVVVADTHCIRISGRLGLTDGTKDPKRVEEQLRAILPPEESNDFCHRLVLFGREVCTARKAFCELCPLSDWCSHYQSSGGAREQ
ncbi:MAG: endonuclease III [Oscillospiraceae bacterium]|nr:endonuclease III [Oscillospiraceae bacterium]